MIYETQPCDCEFGPSWCGREIPEVYDGVSTWWCMTHEVEWHGFPPGDPVRVRLETYLSEVAQ